LYINLVTDWLPALALGFSPRNPHVMQSAPEKELTLLKTVEKQYIFLIGIFSSVLVLFSYYYFTRDGSEIGHTAAFSVLTLIQSFIFIDLWLSHRSVHKNLILLLSPIFVLAFLMPFLFQFVIVQHQFVASIFKIQQASVIQYFEFIFLASLMLVGIKGVKKLLRLS